MNAALPRDAVASLAPGDRHWDATLALAFARRGAKTVLTHCRHHGPLIVQQPLYPEGPQTCHAIVVHPPGGVAGGDRLAIDVDVGAGAHATLTTPGAGKFYKSLRDTASLHVTLRATDGAIVEWMPQETIIFNAADAHMTLAVQLARDARAIVQDIVVLGRAASGERFATGRLRQALTITLDGEAELEERADVAGGSPWLAAAPGWHSHAVSGTLVAAGAPVTNALIDHARAQLQPFAPRAAITQLSATIAVARYLGPSPEEARAAFYALWTVLRPAFAAADAQRPRIWAT